MMGLFESIFGRKKKDKELSKQSNVIPSTSIMIDNTNFRLVNNVDALNAAVEEEGRGVLRFTSLSYGNVLAEMAQKIEKRYGRMSRQYLDIIPSLLLCAGCLWEFPGSYKLSLQAPEFFGNGKRVSGATPGFNHFGKSGICPQCGSDESLLVYEHFKTEQISEVDIKYICKYWQEQARLWWQNQKRSQAYCDNCNDNISRGQGYLCDTRLICQKCRNDMMSDGLENLKKNPHYYGSALLRKARKFRT